MERLGKDRLLKEILATIIERATAWINPAAVGRRVIGSMPRRSVWAAAIGLAGAFSCVSAASSQTAFYKVQNEAELDGPAGTIIRQERMFEVPSNTTAYRILYRSTGLDGKPVAVSGMVIVPQGSPPPGGRPIVAWAHPTTGVIPRCAPSLPPIQFQQIRGLPEMIQRGYVVVATDYPGLGTAGPHPYLVGTSEAMSVLDSVRAARSMPDVGGSNRFAVWGHSQGGQAALFTALLAKNYAPELKLVGVAAAAPATELGALLNDDLNSVSGKNLTSMTLWSWSQIFDAPIGRVVAADAIPTVDQLAGECIESLVDVLERSVTERPLQQDFLLVKNLVDVEPWQNLLRKNSPGALSPTTPVFLAQGASDIIVRPAVTKNYMARLCQAGVKVRMLLMSGTGHAFAGRDSAGAAIAWIDDRFAGLSPPDDCGD